MSDATITFKKIFVDITQNLNAGIVLASILKYYTSEDSFFEGDKDDYLWIVRNEHDWWDECRIDADELNMALCLLMRQELIINKVYKHNGTYKRHIRLNMGKFLEELKRAEELTKCSATVFELD